MSIYKQNSCYTGLKCVNGHSRLEFLGTLLKAESSLQSDDCESHDRESHDQASVLFNALLEKFMSHSIQSSESDKHPLDQLDSSENKDELLERFLSDGLLHNSHTNDLNDA
jgi:hypothetical protein